MNIPEIRAIAQTIGIKPLPKSKVELVRAIQSCEGNFPCFATATAGDCDQQQCRWRTDCFKLAQTAAHQ